MSTKFLKSSWNGWFLSTKITSISGRIMYDALSRCSPAIVWIVWGCVSASIACAVTDVCKSLFTLFQCEKILFIHQTVAWNKVLPTITTRKQSNKLRNMVVQHWSIPISNRIQNVSELIQHPSQASKSSSSSFLFSENPLDLRISHGQQHPFCAPKPPESFASARHWSDVAEAHGGERDGAEVKGGEDVAEPRLFYAVASSGSIMGYQENHPEPSSIIPSMGPKKTLFLGFIWVFRVGCEFLSGMLSIEYGLDSWRPKK